MASSSSIARRTSRSAASPSSISPALPETRPHRSLLAALELGLDESAEIPRDRRALSQRGLTERSPDLVGSGDSRNVVIGPHVKYNV
jgi:hypothetical protein